MNAGNLVTLSNYIHASTYARHIGMVQISKTLPQFTYKKLRNGQEDVDNVINRLAKVTKTPKDDFIKVMQGNDRPVRKLVHHALDNIHDRNGLKHFLTIIAYAKGTTLSKMSLLLGNNPTYLNVLITQGTHERMNEKLTKLSHIFGLSAKTMKDAVSRSKVRHRKFAGGYFGGNRGHFHGGRLKEFVKDYLPHYVNVDKVCKAIDNNDNLTIVHVLAYVTVINHYPAKEFYEALNNARFGRYIPEAKDFIKKLNLNYEAMTVVETEDFSKNINNIGRSPAGSQFIQPTVNYLREFRHIFGISGRYKKMKISGFDPQIMKKVDPQEALRIATHWYHQIPLNNLSHMVNQPKFLKTYRSDIKAIKDTKPSSKILVIRVKTVARFDNKVKVVMYLDLFSIIQVGATKWHSVVQMTPLVFKHHSAKVRKLLKKYRH